VRNWRLIPSQLRDIILRLCSGRYLSAHRLSELTQRSQQGLLSRYIPPMIRERLLALRYPDEPNHPNQAYTAPTGITESAQAEPPARVQDLNASVNSSPP
jgi:hypothetical protein